MKYPVFSVRDKLAGFSAPELSLTEDTMKRTFAHRINNDSNLLFSASDYDLYKVGEWDVDSGQMTPCLPEFVIAGITCVRSE